MKVFNFKLNWQFFVLIVLVLSYSVFCSYDFIQDIQEQSRLQVFEQNHQTFAATKEFLDYSSLAQDSFALMLAEWLSGLGASALALVLILKGQKATIKEAEQHVKIELLSKHINKLTNDITTSADFYAQIEKQFAVWGLSKTECDVAILLLKGLSFKEMADIKGNSEKTLRQQASSIYSKSGLKGRNEFSAFFFEEILMLNTEQPKS